MVQANEILEQKKKIVLGILKKLSGIWDLADGFYVFVESEIITEEILDNLLEMIEEAKNKTDNQAKKEKMQKAMNNLKKLKEKENAEKVNQTKNETKALLENGIKEIITKDGFKVDNLTNKQIMLIQFYGKLANPNGINDKLISIDGKSGPQTNKILEDLGVKIDTKSVTKIVKPIEKKKTETQENSVSNTSENKTEKKHDKVPENTEKTKTANEALEKEKQSSEKGITKANEALKIFEKIGKDCTLEQANSEYDKGMKNLNEARQLRKETGNKQNEIAHLIDIHKKSPKLVAIGKEGLTIYDQIKNACSKARDASWKAESTIKQLEGKK